MMRGEFFFVRVTALGLFARTTETCCAIPPPSGIVSSLGSLASRCWGRLVARGAVVFVANWRLCCGLAGLCSGDTDSGCSRQPNELPLTGHGPVAACGDWIGGDTRPGAACPRIGSETTATVFSTFMA